MDKLGELLMLSPDHVTLKHIYDYQMNGMYDEIWVPQIAKEGWIVVTADRGKKGGLKKGEKLPRLCLMYSVTHVIMSSTIHHQKVFNKVRSFVAVWDEIVRIANEPRGGRYLLQMNSRGTNQLIKSEIAPDVLSRLRRSAE